ncbi:Gag protease polyprotein [Hibiscus syriacus]|uniref:Gag protease polyprotein n=1 Tax=Hibiscus syriacus TaxID=106335 RepID=A0A6A3CV63_HIBSY|nr:Gag protease polyprotein [Hibiscus syriacus]
MQVAPGIQIAERNCNRSRYFASTAADIVHGSLEKPAISDETAAALNGSASKALDVEAEVAKNLKLQEKTKEDGLKITINDPNSLNISIAGTVPNATISLPSKQSRPVRTKLDKNGARLPDPDYVPIGPMHWDAKAFHM